MFTDLSLNDEEDLLKELDELSQDNLTDNTMIANAEKLDQRIADWEKKLLDQLEDVIGEDKYEPDGIKKIK